MAKQAFRIVSRRVYPPRALARFPVFGRCRCHQRCHRYPIAVPMVIILNCLLSVFKAYACAVAKELATQLTRKLPVVEIVQQALRSASVARATCSRALVLGRLRVPTSALGSRDEPNQQKTHSASLNLESLTTSTVAAVTNNRRRAPGTHH